MDARELSFIVAVYDFVFSLFTNRRQASRGNFFCEKPNNNFLVFLSWKSENRIAMLKLVGAKRKDRDKFRDVVNDRKWWQFRKRTKVKPMRQLDIQHNVNFNQHHEEESESYEMNKYLDRDNNHYRWVEREMRCDELVSCDSVLVVNFNWSANFGKKPLRANVNHILMRNSASCESLYFSAERTLNWENTFFGRLWIQSRLNANRARFLRLSAVWLVSWIDDRNLMLCRQAIMILCPFACLFVTIN